LWWFAFSVNNLHIFLSCTINDDAPAPSRQSCAAGEVDQLIGRARDKYDAIMKCKDTDVYTPRQEWPVLPFPCTYGVVPEDRFVVDHGVFACMGRADVERLVNEVNKEDTFSAINVYGTIGYGKSHIIATAIIKLTTMGKRVVFLPSARDLADHKFEYVRHAVALAFVKDEHLCRDLLACGAMDDLQSLLRGQEYDLVVDQVNSLEEGSGAFKKSQEDVAEAKRFISSLRSSADGRRIIVEGFSANNETAKAQQQKQRSERDLRFFGGLNDDEVRDSLLWCPSSYCSVAVVLPWLVWLPCAYVLPALAP
jgi:hypothetical protein